MTAPDSIWRVPPRRKPVEGPLTPLQAAGRVAQDLLEYRRLTKVSAAGRNHTLSVSSIGRITKGDQMLGPGMYRALASVLKVPPNTFILIIENDVKALTQLVMLRPEEDEPIRVLILETMARITAQPRRRVTDA